MEQLGFQLSTISDYGMMLEVWSRYGGLTLEGSVGDLSNFININEFVCFFI